MGRAISKIKHPFRDFNLESRAHKVISQPTPKLAPKHAKDEIDLKRLKDAFPDAFEESLKKNETLDKHLKDVFVRSHDPPISTEKDTNPSKPLPQDRSQPEDFLFGHKEPDKIPIGKTTLRNALKFICQHQENPSKYSSFYIAQEHKLPEDLVKQMLRYYRVFEIYIPDVETNTKATFAGPSMPRIQIIKHNTKLLPAPKDQKNKDDT